jgi:hypothetical protein
MVIVNIMPILAIFTILVTYNCSAPITLPWVQQWRSDTFSSASKCQLSLPKNRQILLTGCWHTQHHTKPLPPASASSTSPRSTSAAKSMPDLPHHASRADPLRPLPQCQARLHPHGRCRPHPERQGRSCAYVQLGPPIVLWDPCCRSPTSPCRQQQRGSVPPCHS